MILWIWIMIIKIDNNNNNMENNDIALRRNNIYNKKN